MNSGNAYDVVDLVNNIPKAVFFDYFIAELGRTMSFSKLRCGGEERMTPDDWSVVKRGYEKMNLPCEDMEKMTEIAYALTRRVVREY